MKTEYQSRTDGGNPLPGGWTTDLTFLRENYRRSLNTLWKRETETPEEADKRRLEWLEVFYKHFTNPPSSLAFKPKTHSETARQWIDQNCPPPPAIETQIDWDTLEPINNVPVWVCDGLWVAGVSKKEFQCEDYGISLGRLTGSFGTPIPTAAIGSTRENALRNLAELQSIKR